MIEVIPSGKIDKQRWDACVSLSKNGNIFGLYDSITTACGDWIGFVYNGYEAVLALPVKKKWKLAYSWHPQFMGPLGVFSSHPSPEIAQHLLGEISRYSWWIKMHYWQKEEIKRLKVLPRIFQELDISSTSMEKIRAGYHENTKRNYKKAIQKQLSVQHMTDASLVIDTFKDNKGGQIENINEDSYLLLRRLMDHWLNTKNGYITAVYDGDILAAIGYFLVWNQTIIYYKGAVTEPGRSNGAMHLLIDHEIENHLGTCKYFDFGGSNTDSVARFYKGFGGADKNYYLYEYKKFKI